MQLRWENVGLFGTHVRRGLRSCALRAVLIRRHLSYSGRLVTQSFISLISQRLIPLMFSCGDKFDPPYVFFNTVLYNWSAGSMVFSSLTSSLKRRSAMSPY